MTLAVQCSRKAIALDEGGGEPETSAEHLERTLAELREKREEKNRNNLVMMAAMAAVALLTKDR